MMGYGFGHDEELPAGFQDADIEMREFEDRAAEARAREMYQPKTGAKCGCKRGVERDNCPNCEGTGWQIDFARIRARHVKEIQKTETERKT